MKVELLPALTDNYMYLIIDKDTREAAIVDPVQPQKVRGCAQAPVSCHPVPCLCPHGLQPLCPGSSAEADWKGVHLIFESKLVSSHSLKGAVGGAEKTTGPMWHERATLKPLCLDAHGPWDMAVPPAFCPVVLSPGGRPQLEGLEEGGGTRSSTLIKRKRPSPSVVLESGQSAGSGGGLGTHPAGGQPGQECDPASVLPPMWLQVVETVRKYGVKLTTVLTTHHHW